MTGAVIGLDTSCYTTSAAAVSADGEVLVSSRRLLPVPEGHRGLRQSEMVFLHTKQLPERVEEVMRCIGGVPVLAVCASARPRDEADSYMPAFQAGDALARSLAAALGVPCFASTHQRGHIRAAMVDSGLGPGPFIAAHLSGGTTDVMAVDGESLMMLGGSLDLHAGQLVDRTGVALGLPFPAGPGLEELARRGRAQARIPASLEQADLFCHLSGAEARVNGWLKDGSLAREDVAAEIYDFLARTVARMLLAAAEKTGSRQALAAGGVASSALFRELLLQRATKRDRTFRIRFGKPEYSGDNAVGIALIGLEQYRRHTA